MQTTINTSALLSAEGFYLLDDNLKCIKSCEDGLLSTGDDVAAMLHLTPKLPLVKRFESAVTINGNFYCARIFPLSGQPEYICELLSRDDISAMALQTDGIAEMIPVCNALEYTLNEMQRTLTLLKNNIDERSGRITLIDRLENGLLRAGNISKNTSEYIGMVCVPERKVLFDINVLCRKLIARCNASLAKCGRYVNYIEGNEKLYLHTDSRRALVALVNAIQNALLYSPRDSVPVLTILSEDRGNAKRAVIRLVNENSMFTRADFSNSSELDFCSQRTGYGMPIIRRFASLAKGTAELYSENGSTILTLSLPAATEYEISEYKLETVLSNEFLDSGLDIIEQKMLEVNELFSDTQ